MNCAEVHELLSAYYDNELAPDVRAVVAAHMRECTDCGKALERFESLSALAQELRDPATPDLWRKIEKGLPRTAALPIPAVSIDGPLLAGRRAGGWLLALAVVAAIALVWWRSRSVEPDGHADLAVNLASFADLFGANPAEAQRELLKRYRGRLIQAADAVGESNYAPAAPETLPDGLTRTSMYVLEMPCCKCIESVYQRANNGVLCVFEHQDEQPTWFGHRPAIKAHCGGREINVVQCDGHLGASWATGQRQVTVLGARNVEELARIVSAITPIPTEPSR